MFSIIIRHIIKVIALNDYKKNTQCYGFMFTLLMDVKYAFLCLINGYIFTGKNITIYGMHRECKIEEMLSLFFWLFKSIYKRRTTKDSNGIFTVEIDLIIVDQSVIDFKWLYTLYFHSLMTYVFSSIIRI